ncbi:NAD-dependent protein deacetylase [Streptosporangium saharense]|uniref:NAD-dependent protein deacetylase n=1 Tax=Streptosporangium saharense TaxID=1706840 RepID=UPI0036A644EB
MPSYGPPHTVRHHGRVSEGRSRLAGLVAGGGVVVLSGAGMSTESGIPDYRGPRGSLSRHTPMTYQDFTGSEAARRRYWARSHVGWRTMTGAAPNSGHQAVATLQRQGLVTGIVTQNVDGLHQAGGAREVVELHGSLHHVVCLDCGDSTPREELDYRLRQANPSFGFTTTTINPDGDVELGDAEVSGFRVVGCLACDGGTLKPDVVFFGETVPADRVHTSYALVAGARLLLVLGSSLTVLSGRRFVLHAARLGIPVVIINQGETRGDPYATLTLDAPLGTILPELAQALA